jgi:phosphate transport system ATP-binding protein
VSAAPHVSFRAVTVTYSGVPALADVSLDIPRQQITAIIGAANSGKTTILRSINRTIDFGREVRRQGTVLVDGQDVFQTRDVYALRRKVGMVAPLPVGLPLSVYDNVAYAPRLAGVKARERLDAIVEHSLRHAALWDEVKGRLDLSGTRLSGGQQQRLSMARALSHAPSILCLNRFSIAVDPVTTAKMEQMLLELKQRLTIVVATNLVAQAQRLADHVVFLDRGRVIESGPAAKVFSDQPERQLTYDYVRGRIG